MASQKADLTRAGTMQVTAEAGKVFLEKNLTEWKKPYLIEQIEDDSSEEEEEAPKAKKPKLSKHATMKGTAKEADALLGGDRPDADAGTRGQQKKIAAIKAEKPKAKKGKLARDNTMQATAKEGQEFTSRKRKSTATLQRASTMQQAKDDAEAVYGKMEETEGRNMRKRATQKAKPAKKAAAKKSPAKKPAKKQEKKKQAKKPQLKKAGTMVNTAKEGKAYLKRQK